MSTPAAAPAQTDGLPFAEDTSLYTHISLFSKNTRVTEFSHKELFSSHVLKASRTNSGVSEDNSIAATNLNHCPEILLLARVSFSSFLYLQNHTQTPFL